MSRPSQDDILRLYRMLRLVRRTEEEIARIYPSDKIKSPVHLSIGQEFVSVGAIDPLNADDVVGITYRGHAAYLAKGGNLNTMMAELYGKAGGCAGGKAGSMHLVGMDVGVLGASAVVGTSIPIGLGYALALKREGKGRVAMIFCGDGATEEGVFAESLNFAALHKLPAIIVCENNSYAIHAPHSKRWATDKLCERVGTYDIPTQLVPNGDVFSVRDAVQDVLAGVRAGDGPAFIEAHCYRWREHVGPNEDFDAGYRSRKDLIPWLENDPMAVLGAMLTLEDRAAIDMDVETAIAEALDFAEASPFPGPEELMTHVYAE